MRYTTLLLNEGGTSDHKYFVPICQVSGCVLSNVRGWLEHLLAFVYLHHVSHPQHLASDHPGPLAAPQSLSHHHFLRSLLESLCRFCCLSHQFPNPMLKCPRQYRHYPPPHVALHQVQLHVGYLSDSITN